jgi:hypothetical protein
MGPDLSRDWWLSVERKGRAAGVVGLDAIAINIDGFGGQNVLVARTGRKLYGRLPRKAKLFVYRPLLPSNTIGADVHPRLTTQSQAFDAPPSEQPADLSSLQRILQNCFDFDSNFN